MPTAFSYARFSSKKQEQGVSLQRQIDLATSYAMDHGLILDQTRYTDLGVSAFRGKNAAHGALNVFLTAVESGSIAKGSILLVENFDRLSRAVPMEAFRLFQRIIDLGIVLITLQDRFIYSTDILDKEPHKLHVVLSNLIRAHDESLTKSKRVSDEIRRRADKGKLPTTRLPTWMKFAPDYKSAELIKDKAKVVQGIFEDTIKGAGAREIARKLNKKGTPVLFYATEWRQASISQLLKNTAAYGEFKGQICLPAVVTKAQFMRVQQIIRDRMLYKGGFSRFNPNNSLVGLSKCGDCGRAMRFLPNRRGHAYVRCVGSVDNGTCDARLFPFFSCETALVVHLTVLETNEGLTRAIFAEKHEQSQALEAEIAMIKGKQETLLRLVEVSGDVEGIGPRLKKHQADIERLQKEHKELGVLVDDGDDSLDIFSDYSALLHGVPGEDVPIKSGVENITELRLKLKMAFTRVLKRVDFLNADKKKWKPTLQLTYINDRTAEVDVTPFLPERTQLQMSHGYWHRADLGVPMKDRKKKPKKRQIRAR